MKRIFMTDKLLSLATMLAAVFSLAVFSACSEEEEAPYIKSGDAGTTITAEGSGWAGWSTVIQSNIDQRSIQTTSSASWCTARLMTSGENTYQLQVSAEDNPTLSNRQAIITVKAVEAQAVVTFTVTQQAGTPYVSFKDGGGDVSIEAQAKSWERVIDSNIEFSKLTAISSDTKWCTAKLESSGNGIMLKLEAQENETIEERKATITVKASTGSVNTSFVVTQQSAAPTISFVDGGEDQTITPDGKNWTWDLSTNLKKDDLAASSTAEWCTVELTGSDSKGISLSVKVAKNESINNRQTVVTVKSTKYDVSLTFRVEQQAAAPAITFSATQGTDQSITAPAKVLTWTMQSNIPYSDLKVASNESWCTVKLTDSNEAKDVKSYPLTVTIAENPTDKQRQAVVTITSEKYNVTKSFMVTQAAATFTLSKSSLGFDRDGGNRTLTITSNASWTAECSADWIELEQNGNYLTVRVKATTVDRTATITFKDKSSTTIAVNQTKYKVGETYSEGGVTGTVAYIGDDKRFIYKNTGKTEPYQQFYLATGTTGTYNMDDGEVNMQFIKRQSGWSGNFLAAVAADDLNTGGVTGWYLPAINELSNMKSFVTGTVWSSTANNNGSFAAYCLSYGTVYSNEDRQTKHGVYAIRKF